MIEIAAVKRKARFNGEVGLFGADETSDDEIKKLTSDTVWAEITVPRNIKQIRFLWALCNKLVHGGLYEDKDEAMEDLKIRARFARFAVENGRTVIVPRSLSRQRSDVLARLINRILFIVCDELLPHIKQADLRKEIEDMVT